MVRVPSAVPTSSQMRPGGLSAASTNGRMARSANQSDGRMMPHMPNACGGRNKAYALTSPHIDEYSPFFDDSVGGGGTADLYVDFLLHTLKPTIDAQFRTRPEPAHTGVLGSSMGGLLSTYAFFRPPHAFGMCGIMSPSIWFADRAILPYVEAAASPPGRIWLDVGTGEGARTVANVRALSDLLARKGYREGESLRTVVAAGAGHTEPAWGRRLKKAVPFLLGS